MVSVVAAFGFALFNESRPVVANSQVIRSDRLENIFVLDSDDLFWITRRDIRQPYEEIAAIVEERGCNVVGTRLIDSPNASPWEYPLRLLLDEATLTPIDVQNPSGDLLSPDSEAELCAVISAPPVDIEPHPWRARV